MKLTTISTLSVVVALTAASLLPGNDGLAQSASVNETAGANVAADAKNAGEGTGANATTHSNATTAALDLLSDVVSVVLVVSYVRRAGESSRPQRLISLRIHRGFSFQIRNTHTHTHTHTHTLSLFAHLTGALTSRNLSCASPLCRRAQAVSVSLPSSLFVIMYLSARALTVYIICLAHHHSANERRA